ncbi:hypothetical protein ACFX13_040907 [Malus domestica]
MKEVKKENSKAEGERDHVPQNLYPGKYRILRRAQEDIVMMPTPRWNPKSTCFRTISPERGIPSPLLINTLCKVPGQMPNFGISQEEALPELMLLKET